MSTYSQVIKVVLINLFRNKDGGILEEFVDSLATTLPPTDFINVLEHMLEDTRFKSHLIQSLDELNMIESVPLLRNMLNDSNTNPFARRSIAIALGGMKNDSVLPDLNKLSLDEDAIVICGAVEGLARRGTVRAYQQLLVVLKRSSTIDVRKAIALFSTKFKPKQAISIFEILLNDKNWMVGNEVIEIEKWKVRLIVVDAIGVLAKKLAHFSCKAKKSILVELSSLLGMLHQDSCIKIRMLVAWAYGELKDKKSLNRMKKDDPSPSVLKRVAESLMKIHPVQ